MRWNFIKCIVPFILLWCGTIDELEAAGWTDELRRLGMENIREAEEENALYLCWEDPVYRGPSCGLVEVIRLLTEQETEGKELNLVILENQIPQIRITIPQEALMQYQQKQIDWTLFINSLLITYHTDEVMAHLKDIKSENRSVGKVDFVLYPQIGLRNAWLDKVYGAMFNIAPAVEVALWKGAYFTGQVIFPVWNNMEGEMDYIRAGILTLRQDIRLPKRWFATVTVGNFTEQRIGADVSIDWRTADDRWKVGVRGGLTGASVFYGGKWKVSRWERATGAVSVRYAEPFYDLELELTGERYIYGDYGVRFDCVRHFGEVSIGLFGMVSGGEVNGGFNFSVPLPRKKRHIRKAVRVRLPEYWGMSYEAQTGNEYAERRLGRRYELRPEESRSECYYNPEYMRKMILRDGIE